MATSRTADALEDLLDLLEEHFEEQPASDDAKRVIDNAELQLDAYQNSERDAMDMVGDQVRSHLARVVQYINENIPELASTVEMERALDILANPHGPGGKAQMSNQGVPTPFAHDEDTLRREEADREAYRKGHPYVFEGGQARDTRRADGTVTPVEGVSRSEEDTRKVEHLARSEADQAKAKRDEGKR